MAPTLARKPKPDPKAIYVAWQGIAYGDDVVPRGERLRGDHPVVKACFEHFVPDGTPRAEWPSIFDGIKPSQEPLRFQTEPLPDEEAAVAVMAFTAGRRVVEKGQRLRRDDPLVKENPELFRTPGSRL